MDAAQLNEVRVIREADPDQKRAIEHPLDGGPVILLAGAGSGKTFTLTGRTAWLIAQGIEPRRILVVTFTNVAAKELRERLGVEEGDSNCPRVSTIHSLALSAIRKDPAGFGFTSKISPLDDGDQADLIDTLMSAKIKGPKRDSQYAEFNTWGFLRKIAYHRAKGLSFSSDYTEEVHEKVKGLLKGTLALSDFEKSLWKEYEDAKRASNSLDFDDMIHLVVRRGQTEGAWAALLGQQFLRVLVDESQDTSPVQWAFLELLVGTTKHDLYAVGDSGQSILGFQGASPEILVGMAASWRGKAPTVYKLERNYRSVPAIVNLANRIQNKMKATLPLVMTSQKEEEPGVVPVLTLAGMTARDIANKIGEKIASDGRKVNGFRYRDNAILVRSNSQIRDVEMELIRYRVPYVIRGGQGIFQSREAKDLVSYLRIMSNPRDVVAFTRASSVPTRGIGEAGIRALVAQAAKGHDGDLIKAALVSPNPKMGTFAALVAQLQQAMGQRGVVEILNVLMDQIGYRALLQARYRGDIDELESKLMLVDRVVETIGAIEEGVQNATLEDIVFRLTMDREPTPDEEDTGGKTVISTIHSVKGLEWARVFVTNLVEGSLPHTFSRTEAEVEEERRLFYVAVTRAQRVLYLCVPATRQMGPNAVDAKPSRFMEELRTPKAAK